ncbi:High osmolarity signaling protein [Trichinella spiralis]|uniref:High osmolarity signaling protein n=1 Tax=Trichinella spiralis TaxID=6334 RepID=A0ABR3KQI1_TRISP
MIQCLLVSRCLSALIKAGFCKLRSFVDKLELESDLPKGKVSRRQVTSGYQRRPRQTGAADIYPNLPAFSFLYSIWLSCVVVERISK